MKKIAFLLICAFAFTVSAMAQKGVIESALKVANNDKSTVEQLKAAAETLMPIIANGTADGETYFAAGKVAYKLYDAYTKLNLLGKQADAKDMSTALLDGYNYMSAALKLDTVPETNKDGTVKIDKKTGAPKFKTKNSKDIVSTLQGYMQNYWDQGAASFEAQDYDGAFNEWEAFCMINDKLSNGGQKIIADSIVASLRYNQGLASYFGQNHANAFASMTEAKRLGYEDVNADQIQMWGLANMVQTLIDDKNMTEALNVVDKAIAANPENAKFYNLKGFIAELNNDKEGSKALYEKSIELDPNYSESQYNLGRYYYNQASQIIQDNPDLMEKDLKPKVDPIYKHALIYIEKAYQLDKDNREAKNALRNIYYQLGDEEKLKAIEAEF